MLEDRRGLDSQKMLRRRWFRSARQLVQRQLGWWGREWKGRGTLCQKLVKKFGGTNFEELVCLLEEFGPTCYIGHSRLVFPKKSHSFPPSDVHGHRIHQSCSMSRFWLRSFQFVWSVIYCIIKFWSLKNGTRQYVSIRRTPPFLPRTSYCSTKHSPRKGVNTKYHWMHLPIDGRLLHAYLGVVELDLWFIVNAARRSRKSAESIYNCYPTVWPLSNRLVMFFETDNKNYAR